MTFVREIRLRWSRRNVAKRMSEFFRTDGPEHVPFPHLLANGAGRACPLEHRRGRGCIGLDCEYWQTHSTEFNAFAGVCVLIDGDWPE